MTVSLSLTGSGTVGEILPGWGVTEDCTPVAPGDLSGGVGSIGLAAQQGEDSEFVIDNLSAFTHDRLGTISGKVASATSNGATEATDTVIPMNLTTPLSRLNAERTAPPSLVGADRQLGALNHSSAFTPLAVDSNGNFLIAIGQVLNPALTSAVHIFPSTPAPAAWGGYVDPSNNYYLSYPSDAIYKWDSSGAFVSSWGSTGSGNGQFNMPIALTGDGTYLYVVDRGNNRVQKLTDAGVYVSQWGSLGTGNGQFTLANFIAHAPDGSIYVGDFGGPLVAGNAQMRVQRFTSTGTFVSSFTVPGTVLSDGSTAYGAAPSSIAIDPQGLLWVTRGYSTMLVYDPTTGELLYSLDSPVPTGVGLRTILGKPTYSVRVIGNPVLSEMFMTATATTSGGSSYWFQWSTRSGQWDLQFAIGYYISLIDPTIAVQYDAIVNPTILLPAWSANVWEQLKQLCAAYAVQIDVVNDVITVSDLGVRALSLDNVQGGSVSLQLDTRSTGRSVNIAYGNYTSGSGTVYDASDYDKVFSVNVGESTTETVRTDNYAITVNQPTQTASLIPSPGEYYVSASDNLPVSPTQWADYGGSVTVAVGSTAGTLDITLTGPRTAIPGVVGPFSLAVSDGTTSHPALSVTGYAVFSTPQTLNLLTGADPDKTPTLVAQDINNFAISTLEQAYDRGIWASVIASGPLLTLSATVPTSAIEGFGLCQGSLVSFKESQYRVTSANIGNAWTSITATRHVTVGERDALHSGRTVGQHDALWDGNTCMDEFIKPFRQ